MINIRGVPELRATALVFRNADRETRRGIQREARTWAPDLQRAVARRARTGVDRQIAASGRITVTARGIKAVFGSSGRLSSGEPLRSVARPYEFGTGSPHATKEYLSRHRVSRRAMRVTRRVQEQVPHRRDTGRFIYPGVADATPELVARWVRAVAQAATNG